MPNGGSDCCGTCWFDLKNKGEPGFAHMKDAGEDRCEIRDLVIADAFYTYCANHPHHNPDRIRIPIGPAYSLDDQEHSGGTTAGPRKVLADSPDTEEIRQQLLVLLEAIPEQPTPEYPSATLFDNEIMLQLAGWRERRASGGLRRILSFNPDASTDRIRSGFPEEVLIDTANVPYRRDRRHSIGIALESLARILGDEALEDIQGVFHLACRHRSWFSRLRGRQEDRNVVLRYWAVKALAHCSAGQAKKLLEEASRDPNPEVAAHAKAILAKK